MPHLWIEKNCEWWVFPLDREAIRLGEIPPGSAPPGILIRAGSAARQDWHLVAAQPTGITVNGFELLGGLRTLQDRDEIRIPTLGSLFFSTERLAVVEPLPESAGDTCCPRCRQTVVPGTAAVRCPSCGVWHHGSQELPCWTYAPGCALCGHPTPMDTGYQWTPEAL